jgi:polyhydroxyalkanoate synthase
MDTRASTLASAAPTLPSAGAVAPAALPPAESPYRAMDRAQQAAMARLSGGLAPASLALAFSDWLIHLASAPGKRLELAALYAEGARRLGTYLLQAPGAQASAPLAQGGAGERRFSAPAWQTEPYRLWQQMFLLTEQWWSAATHAVPGMSPHHERVVSFGVRQSLDMLAPSNFAATNPQVLQRTFATLGANVLQGAANACEDLRRQAFAQAPVGVEQFQAGRDVAVTPGKVVYRNHLIELIQYRAAATQVAAEPILIVPAWIMKYYILDLSPHNSLIRYLVEQGHTVFCISWRNVDAADRELGLDDYRTQGVMAALDAIGQILPDRKVHATGYCLGGTLLAIAAAAMAGRGDTRLASVSLFAAQTDFTEPGELQLFVDDSEVDFLESMMWSQGFLTGTQMSASFQLLHSNDLIWSHLIHDYLLGERAPMIDLMAWNADATRMPYRMHSQYLRGLFLHNDLASGRYGVEGRRVSLHNIRAPMFVVSTQRDHIAPWRSVYKIHDLSDTDLTYVLTTGGHNAGIVSEVGHPNRQFQIRHTAADDLRIGPDEWLAAAEAREGSWWPSWSAWLKQHGTPKGVAPPRMGLPGSHASALDDAPGSYVFQH